MRIYFFRRDSLRFYKIFLILASLSVIAIFCFTANGLWALDSQVDPNCNSCEMEPLPGQINPAAMFLPQPAVQPEPPAKQAPIFPELWGQWLKRNLESYVQKTQVSAFDKIFSAMDSSDKLSQTLKQVRSFSKKKITTDEQQILQFAEIVIQLKQNETAKAQHLGRKLVWEARNEHVAALTHLLLAGIAESQGNYPLAREHLDGLKESARQWPLLDQVFRAASQRLQTKWPHSHHD